jgi:type I restriction enzyme S subunit
MMFRKLDDFIVKRGGSVDPSKFKNEIFELLSIPAFDQGTPEIVEGGKIGSSKKIVEPRDVLLSKIVPHIRRCWIVPERSNKRQIASGEWIQFRGDGFLPEYLRLFLVSNRFHSKFMKTVKGVGGSLLRASPAQVAEIEIPLTLLDNQIRIVHLLGKVEGLIAQRKQHLQQLDDLLKSVFLETFGDPVRNEKGWATEQLGDIALIERGRFSPRPRNDPKFYGGEYPFIQTGDISRSQGRLREYTQTLNDLGIKVSKEFKVGTVVIAIVGATIGATALLEIPTYAPDSVIGITPKAKDAGEAVFSRSCKIHLSAPFKRKF